MRNSAIPYNETGQVTLNELKQEERRCQSHEQKMVENGLFLKRAKGGFSGFFANRESPVRPLPFHPLLDRGAPPFLVTDVQSTGKILQLNTRFFDGASALVPLNPGR